MANDLFYTLFDTANSHTRFITTLYCTKDEVNDCVRDIAKENAIKLDHIMVQPVPLHIRGYLGTEDLSKI